MANNQDAPWRSFVSPRGRNGRARFWLILVLSGLAAVVGAFALLTIADLMRAGDATILFILPVVPAVFFVGVINRIRRLHDLGWSGWWMLPILAIELPLTVLSAVPMDDGGPNPITGLYGLLSLGMLIVFGVTPGQPGANRFGDDPARAAPEEQPA